MVRIKQRYLLLNILYPSSDNAAKAVSAAPIFQSPTPDYVNAGLLIAHIRAQISLLFGDYGLGVSLSSLKVVYFSSATSTAIIRVPRSHHQLVWTAISHITELPASRRGASIPPKSCVVRVVRVSGTIRKAEEELIRRARRDVVRAKLSTEQSSLAWLPHATASDDTQREDVSMRSIEDESEGEDDKSE